MPAEFYAHGSGVIAVVVYGLYGASTYQYGLSSKGLRTGAFTKFFDVLGFCLNGMVFFYVGSSIVNFFLRCGSQPVWLETWPCLATGHPGMLSYMLGRIFAGDVLHSLSVVPS